MTWDVADWRSYAEHVKFDQCKSWTKTTELTASKYPADFAGLDAKAALERVRGALRHSPRYKARGKGKVTFEDIKSPTPEDLEAYYEQLKKTNAAMMALERKQTEASIEIAEDKPIGLAFWGDWHEGGKGVDYDQLDEDTELLCNTDGLYVIGMGDYKENANALIHPSSVQEVIAPSEMQDRLVERRVRMVAEDGRWLALVRGCHDDWDKRLSGKDFIQHLADVAEAVNLWHGGVINLQLGRAEYRIGVRHKFHRESVLNTTNAQRAFIDEKGLHDIVAVAHKHYAELQHTIRAGEDTVYLRSGAYKSYDEFGQKLAGYEGVRGVPVVILWPDSKVMLPVKDLRQAVAMLEQMRA